MCAISGCGNEGGHGGDGDDGMDGGGQRLKRQDEAEQRLGMVD